MPSQGAFPQSTDAAPATPATPAAPADQTAAPAPAAPDQAPEATPGKKAKKVVTAPDTQAPRGTQNGPIVREINVEYIGPKTVAKSVILSNMRTTVGDVYSAASVEEDVRNLYATGFFTNLAIKDTGEHEVIVKLGSEIQATLHVTVNHPVPKETADAEATDAKGGKKPAKAKKA